MQCRKKAYKVTPIIDVPNAYHYKLKGVLRGFGGVVSELIKFNFKSFYLRNLVVFGLKKDPFDTFNYILDQQKDSPFKCLFFFYVGRFVHLR